MMIEIYGIKNCDSVRKALKYFKAHDLTYHFVDFRETPVNEKTIRQWVEASDLKKLFNTRGTTYRTLGLKSKAPNDDEKIVWMAKENMLIKRPVIVFDGKVIIGYNESEYQKNLPHP